VREASWLTDAGGFRFWMVRIAPRPRKQKLGAEANIRGCHSTGYACVAPGSGGLSRDPPGALRKFERKSSSGRRAVEKQSCRTRHESDRAPPEWDAVTTSCTRRCELDVVNWHQCPQWSVIHSCTAPQERTHPLSLGDIAGRTSVPRMTRAGPHGPALRLEVAAGGKTQNSNIRFIFSKRSWSDESWRTAREIFPWAWRIVV